MTPEQEQEQSYWADVVGEEAYRRANTPPMKHSEHKLDEDACCIHCGFDAAEHWHWRHNTYEGRAAALNDGAHEPRCTRRVA